MLLFHAIVAMPTPLLPFAPTRPATSVPCETPWPVGFVTPACGVFVAVDEVPAAPIIDVAVVVIVPHVRLLVGRRACPAGVTNFLSFGFTCIRLPLRREVFVRERET